MATAMSNSVGPGTDDIKDILTEAQKLMGLAREEKAQVAYLIGVSMSLLCHSMPRDYVACHSQVTSP